MTTTSRRGNLRSHYGLTEAQLGGYMRRSGGLEEKLARLLESRLDNVVFRIGLARSVPSARELIRQGHILVNGVRSTSPSHQAALGDTVTFRDPGKMTRGELSRLQQEPLYPLPSYLRRSPDGLSGQIYAEPVPEDVPVSDFPASPLAA